jgi:repressor LexA
MPEQLTQTERRVYEYLIDFLAEHTYQPSIREIGREFRIKSTKTVSDVLQSLARKGFIERDPSRSRGVRLVGYTGVGGTAAVPYYASVRAGEPPIDPAARAGHLVLDRRLAGSERSFMVRAVDDALKSRGVLTGDYVVVDPAGALEDGALVAARSGADVVVRSWSSRDGGGVLTAPDSGIADLTPSPANGVTLLGVVTSVIRSFAPADPVAQSLVPATATAVS